jgi:hypothetical protein
MRSPLVFPTPRQTQTSALQILEQLVHSLVTHQLQVESAVPELSALGRKIRQHQINYQAELPTSIGSPPPILRRRRMGFN